MTTLTLMQSAVPIDLRHGGDHNLEVCLDGTTWRPVHHITQGRWAVTLEWLTWNGRQYVPEVAIVPQALYQQVQQDAALSWKKVRMQALVRDGFQCQAHRVGLPVCGETSLGTLTVHHLLPKAQGGGDELDNLLTLCRACHDLLHHEQEVVT